MCDETESVDVEELKVLSPTPPKTLNPAAADAYLMFQVVFKFSLWFNPFSVSCISPNPLLPSLEVLTCSLTIKKINAVQNIKTTYNTNSALKHVKMFLCQKVKYGLAPLTEVQ